MVNEAIEALKAGDKEKAFNLLRQHLASNPKDATAWLWMSEAASEPAQQIDALQQVLRLAPDHSRAPMIQKRLQMLLHTTAPQPSLSPRPATPAGEMTEEAAEPRPAEGGLRARLQRDGVPPPRPSLDIPIRTEEPVVDLDDWLRVEEPPAPAEVRVEEAPEPDMALPYVPPIESAPIPEPVSEVAVERPAPLPRPSPPQEDKIPGWVWLIMLVSIIIVALFLFFLWQATGGAAGAT